MVTRYRGFLSSPTLLKLGFFTLKPFRHILIIPSEWNIFQNSLEVDGLFLICLIISDQACEFNHAIPGMNIGWLSQNGGSWESRDPQIHESIMFAGNLADLNLKKKNIQRALNNSETIGYAKIGNSQGPAL